MILMKLLIHKGGGERRIETVCGCVQLKDPSVNSHLDRSYQFHQDHFELPEDGALRRRNM
jgi:hypothetical protein